jgi:hypothetical protein
MSETPDPRGSETLALHGGSFRHDPRDIIADIALALDGVAGAAE